MNSFEQMLVEAPIEQFKRYLKKVKKDSVIMEYMYKYPPVVQRNIIGKSRYEGCECTVGGYDLKNKKGMYTCHVYRPVPFWALMDKPQQMCGYNLEIKDAWRDTLKEIREYMVEQGYYSPRTNLENFNS